jgi:hypothetical protein
MNFLKELFFEYVWKIDKLLHALVGLCIYLVFVHYINPMFFWEEGMAVVVVVVAGMGREVYQELFSESGGDPWDFYATFLPALALYLITT